jgi:hypothetical protein
MLIHADWSVYLEHQGDLSHRLAAQATELGRLGLVESYRECRRVCSRVGAKEGRP